MHRMVSKMTQNPALGVFSEALAAMLKEIVEEAVREAMSLNGHQEGELRDKANFLDWLANCLPDANAWPRKGELRERYLENIRLAAHLYRNEPQ